MDEAIRRLSVGSRDALHFDLVLEDTDAEKDMAWGKLRVTLGGSVVWGDDDAPLEDGGVEWRWIDLLAFLGRKWPWLMLEERYPIPVEPLDPSGLRRDAGYRWSKLSEALMQEEDRQLFLFENRHDMAMGVNGMFLPSLFFLSQGKKIWACSGDCCRVLDFQQVKACLQELGDFLAGIVGPVAERPEAVHAVQCWKEKEGKTDRLFWELRTGLNASLRVSLEQGIAAEEYWEICSDTGYQDNEILAAARLSSGFVSLDDQRRLLQRIRETPGSEVGCLDNFARDIVGRIDTTLRPYEQGYALAAALRQALELGDDDCVAPEDILRGWGIIIEEISLDGCPLDGVAFWGKRHGPAVLLNVGSRARPAHEHGRRTSLAHEICHLLIDREAMLPFSEVIGGHTPLYVEQRARAFAAEFLLPRDTAVSYVRSASSLEEALTRLSEDFIVSKEVAAWQIRNSHASSELSEEEQYSLLQVGELHG
jgi:Zn-dependent peptidase ImmA (M78 family)